MKISDIRFGDKIYWGEGRVLHALSDSIFSDKDITVGCRIQYKCSDEVSMWWQGAVVLPIELDSVDNIHYKLND